MKKPIRWYIYKTLCEFGWIFRNSISWKMYYFWLKKCCSTGFNLYGEKI